MKEYKMLVHALCNYSADDMRILNYILKNTHNKNNKKFYKNLYKRHHNKRKAFIKKQKSIDSEINDIVNTNFEDLI